MQYNFKISEIHANQLTNHLYPGDGLEAVAIVICGRRSTKELETFLVHKTILIPYADCTREADFINWSTSLLLDELPEIVKKDQAVFKIHSHPGGYDQFSEIDDASDKDMFSSLYGWFENSKPHGSLILLPDSRIVGRVVTEDLKFEKIQKISRIGYNLRIYQDSNKDKIEEISLRNRQTFGEGTISLLKGMKIGVVGCSGTGSPVIEQLARLGIGNLILIDPDVVEYKNLNRILNSEFEDAKKLRKKVNVIEDSIKRIGFKTNVKSFDSNIYDDVEAINELASCDFLFGCMDSIDGRHLLNMIASFYLIPYIDIGVKLISDKKGGIDQIFGSIHYIQPGKSSLRTRGVYNHEELRAASLHRIDPKEFKEQRKSGYITDIVVEAPAVISINMLASSLAVNEFLSRVHDVKNDSLENFDIIRFSLTDYYLLNEKSDYEDDILLNKFIGRGDIIPFLNMPELSNEKLDKEFLS
jgi:hypothetical protein